MNSVSKQFELLKGVRLLFLPLCITKTMYEYVCIQMVFVVFKLSFSLCRSSLFHFVGFFLQLFLSICLVNFWFSARLSIAFGSHFTEFRLAFIYLINVSKYRKLFRNLIKKFKSINDVTGLSMKWNRKKLFICRIQSRSCRSKPYISNNLRFNFRIGWDFYMVLQLSWLYDALDISYIF